MPDQVVPDLFKDVREKKEKPAMENQAIPNPPDPDSPGDEPTESEPVPDLFSDVRGVPLPEETEEPFFPRFGKAVLTIPVRVAGNIASLFKKDTAKGIGEMGKEMMRFGVQASLLGSPGVPSEMRKGAAAKIKGGDLAPEVALSLWEDALAPFGFSVEETEIDGEKQIVIDHHFNQVKEILATEPERTLEALSILASGGATALAKTGRFPRLVKALGTAAELSEPIGATARVTKFAVSPAAKAMGAISTEVLGLTTGVGAAPIKRAFRNPTPELIDALRGKTSIEGVFTEARDALHVIREDRASRYREQLSELENIASELNLEPIERELSTQLDNFNIKQRLNPETQEIELDFSRSTIANPSDQERIRQVVETIEEWGIQPDDATPVGLDLLKRRLDDFYSEGSNSRAFVAALRNRVREQLVRNVDGYASMVSEYAETTEMIREIERALSLSDKSSTDTALRKLASAMRENNEFRLSLLQKLDELSTQDLIGQVAGTTLSPITPRGTGRFSTGINVLGGFTIDPRLLLALPFQSPRAMGEFMVALGLTKTQADKLLKLAKDNRFVQGATSLPVRQALSTSTSILEEQQKERLNIQE